MGINELVDKIKVNKFAELVVAVGGIELYRLIGEIPNIDKQTIVHGLLGIVAIGSSICLSKIQNYRYDRLVNKIRELGYDERFCSLYMNRPCGRSLVKTALKRTKNFDKYLKLKENYPITTILD